MIAITLVSIKGCFVKAEWSPELNQDCFQSTLTLSQTWGWDKTKLRSQGQLCQLRLCVCVCVHIYCSQKEAELSSYFLYRLHIHLSVTAKHARQAVSLLSCRLLEAKHVPYIQLTPPYVCFSLPPWGVRTASVSECGAQTRHCGQSHRKPRRQTTLHPVWALEEILPP